MIFLDALNSNLNLHLPKFSLLLESTLPKHVNWKRENHKHTGINKTKYYGSHCNNFLKIKFDLTARGRKRFPQAISAKEVSRKHAVISNCL